MSKKKGRIARIHVNQHKIKSNRKLNSSTPAEPVITCKRGGENHYAHEVIIFGQDGLEAARVIYRPDSPLGCGAHVWVETKNAFQATQQYDGHKTHHYSQR